MSHIFGSFFTICYSRRMTQRAEFDYNELQQQLTGRPLRELDRELLEYQKVVSGIYDAHIFVETASGKVTHTRVLSSAIRETVRTDPYRFKSYDLKQEIDVMYAGRMDVSEALAHIMVRKCILDSHHYYERMRIRNRRHGRRIDVIPKEEYL